MQIRNYHRPSEPIKNLEAPEACKEPSFFIGFEIEKRHFVNKWNDDIPNEVGEEVHDSSLFWKFETDSSCGVEAVTHVLPLGGVKSKLRKFVFDEFNKEKTLINESPADYTCGGHITVSCNIKGYRTGINLADKIKHNLAIFYAMFRRRLRHSYCSQNTLILLGQNDRHSPVNIKRNAVEIRLPNAVRNVEQLKNRYDILFKLLKYSITEPISWRQFKQEIQPNLMKMYNRDADKVNEVLSYADSFRHYLIVRDMKSDIMPFFTDTERNRWNARYNEENIQQQ